VWGARAVGRARIIVLHFPPTRLHTEARTVANEIRSALEAGRDREPLDIRTIAAR
jgi:hypothetical protein